MRPHSIANRRYLLYSAGAGTTLGCCGLLGTELWTAANRNLNKRLHMDVTGTLVVSLASINTEHMGYTKRAKQVHSYCCSQIRTVSCASWVLVPIHRFSATVSLLRKINLDFDGCRAGKPKQTPGTGTVFRTGTYGAERNSALRQNRRSAVGTAGRNDIR